VSMLHRRDIPENHAPAAKKSIGPQVADKDPSNRFTSMDEEMHPHDKQSILKQIYSGLDESFAKFIDNNLPDLRGDNNDALVLDDIPDMDKQFRTVNLLAGRTRINDVRRLNQFMKFCSEHVRMGGYFTIRYMPYENVIRSLKKHYPGPLYWAAHILHFIWYCAIPKIPGLDRLYFSPLFSWLDTIHLSLKKKRNRALSKAEVWGRISFSGMSVLAESEGDCEHYVIAQKVSSPLQNKIPSYYPIASLEKVGLDGKNIRTHKIRTMYPFSEFLQKRIFEDHGLATTGKFANDFRLTEYGRFLRKYWLDELPQIFDWLRGDVKLVGMRATSPHFLSLYPKKFYDLYIQIKPGLIPPIFDENTNGFDQIVDVEMRYLQSYWERPFRTDIRYFMKTFTDIVFRGIRSK
jgi:lipopolysaccharide/colanic/teichoic acid biosynthesis glycosyltransferase